MAAPTVEPGAPVDAAHPAERLAGEPPNRLVRVCVNLLPEEVIAARRLRKLQRQLAVGLVALLVLLGLGMGYSVWQTGQANGDLSAAQSDAQALSTRQAHFAPLVRAQGRTATLQEQLRAVMASDLSWSRLIASVNSAAAGEATVVSITGQTSAGQSATSGTTAASTTSTTSSTLGTSGQTVVGQVTLSGVARSYAAVGAFAQRLSTTKGFTLVNPASVATGEISAYTFSITLSLTDAVLGGRFTPATTSPTSNAAGGPAATGAGAGTTLGGK